MTTNNNIGINKVQEFLNSGLLHPEERNKDLWSLFKSAIGDAITGIKGSFFGALSNLTLGKFEKLNSSAVNNLFHTQSILAQTYLDFLGEGDPEPLFSEKALKGEGGIMYNFVYDKLNDRLVRISDKNLLVRIASLFTVVPLAMSAYLAASTFDGASGIYLGRLSLISEIFDIESPQLNALAFKQLQAFTVLKDLYDIPHEIIHPDE
jgi:hypothetical protein